MNEAYRVVARSVASAMAKPVFVCMSLPNVATAFTMAGEEATGQFVDAPADENAADGAAKDVASIMDAKVHARPAVGQRPQNH